MTQTVAIKGASAGIAHGAHGSSADRPHARNAQLWMSQHPARAAVAAFGAAPAGSAVALLARGR
jgi:hypothetical protein